MVFVHTAFVTILCYPSIIALPVANVTYAHSTMVAVGIGCICSRYTEVSISSIIIRGLIIRQEADFQGISYSKNILEAIERFVSSTLLKCRFLVLYIEATM